MMRVVFRKKSPIFFAFAVLLASNVSAFAKCPISAGATLVVRAEVGDLYLETTGRDAVEVTVDNNAVQVQETCGKDVVELKGGEPGQMKGAISWRIVAPRSIHLDFVTLAGNITIGDVDRSVLLRTAGGSVTANQIRGKATITTQGGFIRSGDIGGDAELRSQGGTIEAGDIGGNAELYATAGVIRAGNVAGSVFAQAGRNIYIRRGGDVRATATGDIAIDDAARINVNGGGNITSRRVRGPVQAKTEAGDIRLDSAGSWVEASTRRGNIVVRLVPENYDGDLHMELIADVGDVTVYLPPRLRASLEASVQRGQQIISDFPFTPQRPPSGFIPNRFYTENRSDLNGGGNKIVLQTAFGKINIRKY